MDRIGAMREAYRLQNCRAFLPAPVLFWRRIRLSIFAFGFLCFFSGFAIGQAQASVGSLRYVVECKYKGTTANSTSSWPCQDVGATTLYPVTTQFYLPDAVAQNAFESLVVNQAFLDSLTANKAKLDWLVANQIAIQNTLNNQSTLSAQSFDPAVAGQFFGWGFTGLMLVGIAAWGAGSLLGFVNRVMGVGHGR